MKRERVRDGGMRVNKKKGEREEHGAGKSEVGMFVQENHSARLLDQHFHCPLRSSLSVFFSLHLLR